MSTLGEAAEQGVELLRRERDAAVAWREHWEPILNAVIEQRDVALDLLQEWDTWAREMRAAIAGPVPERLPPAPVERTRALLLEAGRSLTIHTQ